jgi:hypothetical protein
MSKQRNELDCLINLPPSEIEHRTAAALERVEARAARCTAENRDLTDREQDRKRADTEELTALRQAAACQEQIESRSCALGEAIECRCDTRRVGLERFSTACRWPRVSSPGGRRAAAVSRTGSSSDECSWVKGVHLAG